MKRHLEIGPGPIDEARLVSDRRMSAGMGAAVYFVGVVRGREEGREIEALHYEAFTRMAEHQFGKIFDAIQSRWPVESVRVVHRTGPVKVNEASLWAEVVAPRRAEAFAAGQFLVEEMKRWVPIWKRPIP